jgi:iron(III) transport system substrate-binding protein
MARLIVRPPDGGPAAGRISRRGLLGVGLGVVGAALLDGCSSASGGAPAANQQPPAAPTTEDALYQAAKQEGKVVWWTAHYAQSAADAVRDAFVAKYPGIEVEFIRQTAQVIYQRLTQNLQAGVREVDVFASTDEAHYLALRKQGALATYTPLGEERLPETYRNVDADHTYHVGAIAFVLVNYSPARVPAPPQQWTDLVDGRWRDQITLGHPGFSGLVGNWVVAMWDKYGWDYFTDLARNNPKIARSINDTVTDIVGGERFVGAGPDNYSLERKAGGSSIDIVFPTDDAILGVSPVAVMKDAPHPNAGRLFESFYYTPEYSATMARTYNYPLLESVAPPSGKRVQDVKWYRNQAARLEDAVPQAIAKWRETFGV